MWSWQFATGPGSGETMEQYPRGSRSSHAIPHAPSQPSFSPDNDRGVGVVSLDGGRSPPLVCDPLGGKHRFAQQRRHLQSSGVARSTESFRRLPYSEHSRSNFGFSARPGGCWKRKGNERSVLPRVEGERGQAARRRWEQGQRELEKSALFTSLTVAVPRQRTFPLPAIGDLVASASDSLRDLSFHALSCVNLSPRCWIASTKAQGQCSGTTCTLPPRRSGAFVTL